MSFAAAISERSLVPPAVALRTQITNLNPRLRAVGAYVGTLSLIHDADSTTTMEGMTITLPNPFKEFPEVGAALRRAQGRSSAYGSGNQLYFRWIFSVVQYGYLFDASAGRISAQYQAMPADGPTLAQRAEVLNSFGSLVRTLVADRNVLVNAEESFLNARALLEEDKGALSDGAPAMNRVIQRYEERIRDEVLKLGLYPATRGLANIMSKAGGAQLEHLRKARESITGAAAACGKAHEELSLIAGHLLTVIGRYQGVEAGLKVAEGNAFLKYVDQFQLNIARETWKALSTYAMEAMKS